MTESFGRAKHGGDPDTGATLDAISVHLDKDQRLLSGIDQLFGRAGYSKHDILTAFGGVEEFLVALASRYADQLADLLTRRDINDITAAREILIRFGTAAWKNYSATFVGLVRLIIAEGARSRDLRDRVYEAGPTRVSKALCEFLIAARDAGVLDVPDAPLATEQLMGALREPLYQALLLHPMAEAAADRADAAMAAIDLFLDGCARRSS